MVIESPQKAYLHVGINDQQSANLIALSAQINTLELVLAMGCRIVKLLAC
jgi:hypothetical protein